MNRQFNRWLFVYPELVWQFVMILHLASLAFLYAALLQNDYLEFWGVKQAWRGIRALAGRPAGPPMRLFGTHRLETTGVYGVVRHPMMAGGFWFLLTSGPSLNNMLFAVFYAAYMVIGGYYEEQRLIRVFGNEYRAYRRQVPPFLPRPWRRAGA
jgi:protein-S-isoprenylcysteine O-methyltransferase Ste14